MKKCFKCDTEKSLDEFYKHKGMADGRLNKCKDCTRADVKTNSDRVGNSYDITRKGVMRVMYQSQKNSQKVRWHGKVPYTKSEFVDWCISNGFDCIYDDWVKSGHEKGLKPSVDRLDDFKGYSLDNIRLVTWGENRAHQASDIRNGTGTGGKRCKAVLKMNEEMEVICEYVSFNAAKRDVGYHMEYAIKNGTKCKQGFYWKYK